MRKRLYEWIDARGSGIVTDWDLETPQAAKLELKFAMLRGAEVSASGRVSLPTNLVGGPGIDGYSAIYELKIRGNVALRPMLCLGPCKRDEEWTFLARAIEKGNKLKPPNAAATAEARRLEIIANPTRRRLILDENDDDADQ